MSTGAGSTNPAASAPPKRSARHRAREYALQGMYQWLLSGGDAQSIHEHIADDKNFTRCDTAYFSTLLRGTIAAAHEFEALIAPALDRPVPQLSPVERAILLLATFELRESLDIPYRVVLNEAVELAKSFGGTDGHKFVNGVLDKVAPRLRPDESGAGAGSAVPPAVGAPKPVPVTVRKTRRVVE